MIILLKLLHNCEDLFHFYYSFVVVVTVGGGGSPLIFRSRIQWSLVFDFLGVERMSDCKHTLLNNIQEFNSPNLCVKGKVRGISLVRWTDLQNKSELLLTGFCK